MSEYVKPFLVSLVLHGVVLLTALVVYPSATIVLSPAPIVMKAKIVRQQLKKKPVIKKEEEVGKPSKLPKNAETEPSKLSSASAKKEKKPTITPSPQKNTQSDLLPKKAREVAASSSSEISKDKLDQTHDIDNKKQKKANMNDLAMDISQIDSSSAEEDKTTIGSYISLIQTLVIRHWDRPSSARKGMTVMLRVRLTPTGEIISVRKIKGSGNEAFDDSAIAAVEDAAPFRELMQLDNRLFENAFREFNLNFNPQDLFE